MELPELSDIIRREIAVTGPLSFARFMHLALYHPLYGYYYGRSKQVGCQGDFFTSVSAGDLFGRLLGFQFVQWFNEWRSKYLQRHGDSPSLNLVETGVHSGDLANDILRWIGEFHPSLLNDLTYWCLEPSESFRANQQQRLAGFGRTVRWISEWSEFPNDSGFAIVFSNELLDAFPIFRAGWDGANRTWFEWRVSWQAGRFVWTRSDRLSIELRNELEQPFWRQLPPELLCVLPDGYTVEFCPAATVWWQQAAAAVRQGKLVTLDYGFETEDQLMPERIHGTLRGYRNHRVTDDPLGEPGKQDLTAHVNFTPIIAAGEVLGWETEYFGDQSKFLTKVFASGFQNGNFGAMDAGAVRQFQTLTHPSHLGRAFKVLVQRKE